MRIRACVAAVVAAVAAALVPSAAAKPPLEAFADQATIRAMALSPDGSSIAYISVAGGREMLAMMGGSADGV